MNNKFLLILTFFCILIIAGLALLHTRNLLIFPTYQTKNIEINNKKFTLYVADTSVKREQGLSDIPSLPADQGMIFAYPKANLYSFWMKDMRFSLDFIYINNNRIVDIKENVSPDTYPQTFTSKEPADAIIEFNNGTVKNNGIKVGMEIKYFQ